MAQPYFDLGQQYLQQSAAPVSASDVSGYYNPMASNVTAQMQNIFGQQQRNTTGQLTQAAGGVGADRIAVGQSELANQQGLAAGQTYASLYQQALQAAQQQKQMQAGAGFGIAQMGPAAQGANLQGTTALGQAGSQQQQLAQAQQTAGYQQQLAQIAYPFQTPQYLAGITAGLAPAAGGSTAGQSTTTYPSPSPLAQALGIGTSAIGLGGAMGGFGGGIGKGTYGGAMSQPGYNTNQIGMFGGNRGGAVHGHAEGGAVKYGDLANKFGANLPGNPYADLPHFADGGDLGEGGPYPLSTQGLPFPGAGQIPKGVVPTISLPAGGGQGTGGHLSLQHQYPSMPGSQGTHSTQDINAAMALAKSLNNYSMARGGSIYPHFADGGFEDTLNASGIADPGSAFGDYVRARPERAAQRLMRADNIGYQYAGPPPPVDMPEPGGVEGFPPQRTGSTPFPFQAKIAQPSAPIKVQDRVPSPTADTPGVPGQTPELPPPLPVPRPTDLNPDGDQEGIVVSGRHGRGAPGSRGAAMNQDMSPDQYFAPKSQQPYPDATQRDWGQNLTRSPWMSLVKAGAAMASSTGPIGSVIGKGIAAGAGELEGQRKELRSEEDHNQKADALWQRAKIELDKYQRKTPHELATEQYRAQSLAQGKYTPVNYIDENGQTQLGAFDGRRNRLVNPNTDEPITNAKRIIGRSSGLGGGGIPASIANAAYKAVLDTHPELAMKPDSPEFQQAYEAEVQRRARAMGINPGVAPGTEVSTQAGPGSSAATAQPDPGDGKREPGKWYIGPSGKPQQWRG